MDCEAFVCFSAMNLPPGPGCNSAARTCTVSPCPRKGCGRGFRAGGGLGAVRVRPPKTCTPPNFSAARQPQPKQGCATIKTVTFTGHNPNNFPHASGDEPSVGAGGDCSPREWG